MDESRDETLSARLGVVGRALAEFRRGRFVIIDGADGPALAQAAETVSPESLAALRRIGNGGAGLALTARRARVLDWPTESGPVVTLDLAHGFDAETIRLLADPTCRADQQAAHEVTIEGAGNGAAASGAVMLSKLAQLLPAAVFAPVAGGDPVLADGLARVGVEAIAAYPRLSADSLRPVSEARVPLAAAENTRIIGFRPADGGPEQFAIVIGEPAAHQPALCRLHSECFTGDLLGSLRCDCGPQLERALRMMGEAGHGVLLYLAHEGRGIGLINKLRAYRLQDAGLDTVDANQHLGFEPDERSYRAARIMLAHLGIDKVRLLTNNPTKVEALAREGIEVVERVPHAIPANVHNRAYLATKASRAGHYLNGGGS